MPNRFLEPFEYNGFIYFLLFSALGFFALIPIILSFLGYKDKTRRHYTRKLWFHVLLAFFGLFESVYAVSLILNEGYSRWGLVLHTMAMYLQVLLFALIVNFWKLSLNDISRSAVYGVTILGVNGVVTVVTVIAILVLDVSDFFESIFNPLIIVVNSLTLLIMSFSLLLYGHHMKNNLTDSTSVLSSIRETSTSTSTSIKTNSMNMKEENNVNLKIKFKMLARINKILIIVLVCYSMRVLALGYLFVTFLTGNEAEFMGITLWLVWSWLIPSLPALMYLKIMKLSSNNPNRGAKAFKFFEDDNVTESAMMDDERGSDDWDSRYERFSDSTCNTEV